MTREEAKIKVELLDYYLSHTCQDYEECDHEAMMMAIKTLEQEPVLDKIRAEIEQRLGTHGYVSLYNRAINDVLMIIDKHKAESESQESEG